MSSISQINFSYELQDTIHTLREENLHLNQRLKNLTKALRDMRKLLVDHSHASPFNHKNDKLQVWNEWIKKGVSTEIHLMLEQAFCSSDLHSASQSCTPQNIVLVLSGLAWIFSFLIQILSF
ncbi:hypothetical protein DNTS_001880 [Danionella cerebrum]|uniref:Uncharacterized protein n=1 Tax=Danionella cerebrum TaxID=2873325 RepID=A0A553QXD6_9TELE|nr:hypothetical protein DNTS_001880 [Danionella translucida]